MRIQREYMKNYFKGFYCRDDLHLQVVNKDSNRRILECLRSAHPAALSVEEISKRTKLPIKTIYAQKAELFREYFVEHLDIEEEQVSKRGRPSIRMSEDDREKSSLRKHVKLVLEETAGVHDPYNGRKPTPLPPGRILYADGFDDVFKNIFTKDEQEEFNDFLIRYVQRIIDRIGNYNGSTSKRRWIPEHEIDSCCAKCGLNHQARDFIRAVLLNIIDEFEDSNKFITFLKDNELLTQTAFERINKKIISR